MVYKDDLDAGMVQYMDHKTISLQTVIDGIEHIKRTCELNHKDPNDVPVVIKTNNLNYAIPSYGIGVGIGSRGTVAFIEYYSSDKIMPIVKDERPVEGEYWQSRGPSDWDVSGFVRSKAAGERLLRMVKLVLEKDECETWLDWRETEPEWIQFKFSAKEFDVEKLSQMAKDNDNIMTIEIIKECMIKK